MQNKSWPTKKLTDLCKLERGTEPGSDSYVKDLVGTIPFLRVGDLTGKVDAKRFVKKSNNNLQVVNKNETLITFDGTPGIVVRGFSGAIASGVRVIRNLKPEINGDFLFYYLQTPVVQKTIRAYSKGATIIHASAAIPHIKISLPPLKIQQKIVERLDAIKKAQELNDKQIELAEELFQNLLYRELDPKGKNWEIKKLGEAADFKRGPFGGSLKKEIFVNKGYKIYEQQNIISNDFTLGNYYITEDKYKKMLGFAVKPGDLIMSCSGTIGKVVIVPKGIEPGIINQALLKLAPLRDSILGPYLKFLLESDPIQVKILKQTRGSSITNVASVKEIKSIKIPLPPIETQKKIVEKLSVVRDYKKKLLAQKQLLRELFDSVLNKSFKGQL